MYWIDFPRQKKEIVISSLLEILDIKYPNWQENQIVQQYRNKNGFFDFDMKRLSKFSNDEYKNVGIETAKINIKKAFK